MANVIAGLCTLAAVGNSSGSISLDPTARTTSLLLNLDGFVAASSNGSDVIIQGTYDYPVATGGQLGGTVTWFTLSTTHYSSAVALGTSNGTGNMGAFLTITGPIAGLRLSSSTYDSTAGTITLKALQSITAGP
jgi:hypothetical protein